MDAFQFHDQQFHAEAVALADIAAAVGTPCYVYSRRAIEQNWQAFERAFADYPHQIFYAVKANDHLAILDLLARLGSGFDIVSGGELARVMAAGGSPAKTVFSGVCKQAWEIHRAIEVGIGCFNIESTAELHTISRLAAECGAVVPIAVRINPNVDAKTHPYIATGLRENKFGLPIEQAMAVYRQAAADPHLRVHGVACHIGSQLTELSPYRDALTYVLQFVEQLQTAGITLAQIDFGGGLGVCYRDEKPPTPQQYVELLTQTLTARAPNLALGIEPGRAIVANTGVLLTEVCHLKHHADHHFCVVDAGMNDLLRPALYAAYHPIVAVQVRTDTPAECYDVVGPVCESADCLAKQRTLCVQPQDWLAITMCGAYGAVMSSNYNARPRPAEVMVDGDQFQVIRPRATIESLYADEQCLAAD